MLSASGGPRSAIWIANSLVAGSRVFGDCALLVGEIYRLRLRRITDPPSSLMVSSVVSERGSAYGARGELSTRTLVMSVVFPLCIGREI